jgi:hypothetical protein
MNFYKKLLFINNFNHRIIKDVIIYRFLVQLIYTQKKDLQLFLNLLLTYNLYDI